MVDQLDVQKSTLSLGTFPGFFGLFLGNTSFDLPVKDKRVERFYRSVLIDLVCAQSFTIEFFFYLGGSNLIRSSSDSWLFELDCSSYLGIIILNSGFILVIS